MIDLRGRLAFCLSDTHQHDESIATWEELIPVVDARFGRDHYEALGWRMGYGECLDASRRYGEAIEVLRDVVDRLRHQFGDEDEDTRNAANMLAGVERVANVADSGS